MPVGKDGALMKKLFKFAVLVYALLLCAGAFAEGLTEQSVKAFISQVDRAILRMDADGVGEALSDQASITLNIAAGGQKAVYKYSKHEYLEILKEGWSKYTNYKYRRTTRKLTITGNRALIIADVHESMTVQGRNISGTASEEVTVELINGSPRITEIVGYAGM
jgi:hypothetical protein